MIIILNRLWEYLFESLRYESNDYEDLNEFMKKFKISDIF